jgi:hypothetical protein
MYIIARISFPDPGDEKKEHRYYNANHLNSDKQGIETAPRSRRYLGRSLRFIGVCHAHLF